MAYPGAPEALSPLTGKIGFVSGRDALSHQPYGGSKGPSAKNNGGKKKKRKKSKKKKKNGSIFAGQGQAE